MGETSKKLLEKIPPEKCWAISTKMLTGLTVLRIYHYLIPLLGKGKGIFAPVMGWKKHLEINTKIFAEGGRKFIPWVKETFNIPVEDAIGGGKLVIAAATLLCGPELEAEIVEGTAKRAVGRTTKCPWWERYKEFGVDPELTACPTGDQAWGEEGLNAVNPKLRYKVTKAMPWGDPYCEFVYEFKGE